MVSENARRSKILIVDDEPILQETLHALLIEDLFDFHFASTGEEGIHQAEVVQPDVILMDIMMPGMDGFEACRRLRGKEELRDVPIIFISALEEVSHKVNAFKSGGNDYINKPFQTEEVVARVSTHIALYRMRQELHDREESLRRDQAELEMVNRRLLEMSKQLAQAEKQAVIGQLAAGVAREINTPLSLISSNLSVLDHNVMQLFGLLEAHGEAADLPFLRADIPKLINESKASAERVRVIVQNILE